MEQTETIESAVDSGATTATENVTRRKVVVYLNTKKGWNPLPPNMRGDTSREIGPSFLPPPSRSVCRGLSIDLEAFLLPAFIGVNSGVGSQDFPAKATEYWNNFSFVAREEGTELDISTEKRRIPSATDPSTSVEVDFPLVPEDYMTYRMIVQNPKVASRKEDLENLTNWQFYIVDLEEKLKDDQVLHTLNKEVIVEYSKLVQDTKNNRERMLQILELMKEPGQAVSPKMTDMELEMQIKLKTELKPLKNEKGQLYHPFLRAVRDKHLHTKAFIERCVSFNVLTKEGNSIFSGEENLGVMKEAIVKLEDKLYVAELQKLKLRLEQAERDSR